MLPCNFSNTLGPKMVSNPSQRGASSHPNLPHSPTERIVHGLFRELFIVSEKRLPVRIQGLEFLDTLELPTIFCPAATAGTNG